MIEEQVSSPSTLTSLAGIAGRFQYWRGASGKRYIHSIYPSNACPPLPGAVYLVVRVGPDGVRQPIMLGRFPPFWATRQVTGCADDEIHVHLLAEDDTTAHRVLDDLRAAIFPDEAHRHREPALLQFSTRTQ